MKWFFDVGALWLIDLLFLDFLFEFLELVIDFLLFYSLIE
jgi:hypothetical protein